MMTQIKGSKKPRDYLHSRKTFLACLVLLNDFPCTVVTGLQWIVIISVLDAYFSPPSFFSSLRKKKFIGSNFPSLANTWLCVKNTLDIQNDVGFDGWK